jgi:hypothetical protein
MSFICPDHSRKAILKFPVQEIAGGGKECWRRPVTMKVAFRLIFLFDMNSYPS